MWNDEEKLQEELNWRPRGRNSEERARERTPPGVSAIMAMGCTLAAPVWIRTMQHYGSVSDLAVLKLILIFAVEGCVALMIAQFIWRLMGPIPRTLIRPLMILGPLPPLAFICCFGGGLYNTLFPGAATKPSLNLASQGDNWGIPRDSESVRFSEAQALCAKLGPPWRVPKQGELARLEPTPPLGVMARRDIVNAAYTNYWLVPAPDTNPKQDIFLRVFCMNKQCRPELGREKKAPSGSDENKGAAICVNF